VRKVQAQRTAFPVGYSEWRVDSELSLLLPSSVAQTCWAERNRREDAEEDRRRNESRLRQEAALAQGHQEVREKAAFEAQAKLKREMSLWRPPEEGSHRVLPKLRELTRQLDEPHAMERSADTDVNQRRRRLLEKLQALGPDRRVAVPVNGQQALDELEAALPNFREPIRSIRSALALAQATKTPPRIAPQLLLGPPGLGKTFFSHRVAELFGATHGSVQFDQPSGGVHLAGSDAYWGNSRTGMLFNLICLGEVANPVILLDEVDKACSGSGRANEVDALAQLHGALERETAQRMVDASVDVEFDASLVTYIGTANSLRGLEAPILSRMEVFTIAQPDKWEAVSIARAIAQGILQRLGLEGRLSFERQALYLLAHLSPRHMTRAAEKAVAAAVAEGRECVGEDALWKELPGGRDAPLH